jgi:hypothetical protein
MLIRRSPLLPLILGLLTVCAQAQVTPEPQLLLPDKPIEREIAGGELHPYQINLQTGQFIRFRLDQRAIDAALIECTGRQALVEMVTGPPGEESISIRGNDAGQLSVDSQGRNHLRGSYRLGVTAAER